MEFVHNLFRREFGLMSGLVRESDTDDPERVSLVAEHIAAIVQLYDHHHHGEDAYVWPLLLDRARDAADDVAQVLAQHDRLTSLVGSVVEALTAWRVGPSANAADRLADALDRLVPVLDEHLDDEERGVVPLMERHIRADEWDDIVALGAADADPESLPLTFGMLMYEGDPQIVAHAVSCMPAPARPFIRDHAAAAFTAHALRLYGTTTPPRSGELPAREAV
jgi:hemerythrin-like domain-containing protein